MALETEDALDDIRVEFESGWTALVQAKRTLRKGKPLSTAVAQWVDAAQSSPDPGTLRLVIVAGSLSGPMKVLQRVLERHKSDQPGPPTAGEAGALAVLDELLSELTVAQRALVLRCGVICELAVEELEHTGSREAVGYLGSVVSTGLPEDALRAWKELTSAAGRMARIRGGHLLEGWLSELRGTGIELTVAGNTPAAELERLSAALRLYRDRMIREGSSIDLRDLGAQFAPLPIAESDAQVRVGNDLDDPRAEADLVWAFLRRGRVVLTGLPGGGKSTAIRILAAQLCELPGAPLPIRVSLKDVDALGHERSFQDRLLSIAVRDDQPEDRELIRGELERRLSAGGVSLLMDSLDETYDQRASVTRQIDELMSVVSNDVDALLSTRDVAYGFAATLGWPNLALRRPQNAERIIKAILIRAGGAQPVTDARSDADQWVDERMQWVRNALAADSTLQETPLFPVLLALLAAEKDIDTLPKGRARILEAVVRDAVSRHELSRPDTTSLGPLTGRSINTAAMHAFASEASAILGANGRIGMEELVSIIGGEIAAYWDMSLGNAEVTARDAVRFFDVSGIFVITGSQETVAPRVALFAEIGDALRAITQPDKIVDWVNARIDAGQFEPLILAAGINQSAAEAFGTVAGQKQDRSVLHAAVRAYREGAVMNPLALRAISAGLIADMATGTSLGWDSWLRLLELPITADMRETIESAATTHDLERQKLMRAALDLRFRSPKELQHEPESLLAVLTIRNLPQTTVPKKQGTSHLREIFTDRGLHSVQVAAAEVLVGVVPAAHTAVIELVKNGPRSLVRDLQKILVHAGFQADAAKTTEDFPGLKIPDWLRNFDQESERRLLNVLADRPLADLTYQQQTRVDELADLLETLHLNEASSLHMFRKPDEIPAVLELTETLFGFDSLVVSAQAQLTLQRMDTMGNSDPYYALFDGAEVRDTHNWKAVANPDEAVILLGRMMTWGEAHAKFACMALWDSPVADRAAPMLREILPNLASSTRHERLAAHTLSSLVDGPEPKCWIDGEDPVLRAVAAAWCEIGADEHLSDEHLRLLSDPDGHVREAALQRASRLHPRNIQTVLTESGSQTLPGWMCLSCRTKNHPGATGCAKSNCFRAGPDLPRLIEKLLLEIEPDDISRDSR
ncbi:MULTISPECIES: NACHT domain-containing protein [unclassified Arthrobacter]|uniref:NACHT domain-containing protein n=1 Tax=unclassified Arthrobacter TaxID=235627 RepID=UPI0014925E6B|nr:MULTISPECIES: hypothetical protein [unclassified Arthrobacter]NOJ64359.1 hypothetical protein [Arthrobacter sp. 147(2020)]